MQRRTKRFSWLRSPRADESFFNRSRIPFTFDRSEITTRQRHQSRVGWQVPSPRPFVVHSQNLIVTDCWPVSQKWRFDPLFLLSVRDYVLLKGHDCLINDAPSTTVRAIKWLDPSSRYPFSGHLQTTIYGRITFISRKWRAFVFNERANVVQVRNYLKNISGVSLHPSVETDEPDECTWLEARLIEMTWHNSPYKGLQRVKEGFSWIGF